MVRSIGPIGKKAGLCARVPVSLLAGQGPQRVPPRLGLQSPWVPQQPWQWPSQQLWVPLGRRRFSPRQGWPWWLPWVCWCRLSLPGLLAIRAGPSCFRSQGRVASLPGFYRGAIVSTWADANGDVADTTQTHQVTCALQGRQPVRQGSVPAPAGRCPWAGRYR